jgi:hypothetical protein
MNLEDCKRSNFLTGVRSTRFVMWVRVLPDSKKARAHEKDPIFAPYWYGYRYRTFLHNLSFLNQKQGKSHHLLKIIFLKIYFSWKIPNTELAKIQDPAGPVNVAMMINNQT